MIAFIRGIIVLFIFLPIWFCLSIIYCLCRPKNPKNLYFVAGLLRYLAPVFGIKLIRRFNAHCNEQGAAVYIANHQSNFDMITISSLLIEGTVTVGKKSLLWVPFFGIIYWVTGNILIDRNDKKKARGTIQQIADHIKRKQLSIWMFPEGTRSRGRGLLPFKTGAFHAALLADVPIIPMVCSSTQHLNVNRWNNGHVIVEMMPPISSDDYTKESVREYSDRCYQLMSEKLELLNQEVSELNRLQQKKGQES